MHETDHLQMTQQMDQAGAALIEFAATLASYMRALMKDGFTRREAMELVTSYQQTMFRVMFGQANPSTDKD